MLSQSPWTFWSFCFLGDHSSQALHLPVSFPALKRAPLQARTDQGGGLRASGRSVTERSAPEAHQGAQAALGTWTSPKPASSTFSWSQRLPLCADFPIQTPEILQTQAVFPVFLETVLIATSLNTSTLKTVTELRKRRCSDQTTLDAVLCVN